MKEYEEQRRKQREVEEEELRILKEKQVSNKTAWIYYSYKVLHQPEFQTLKTERDYK